MESLEQFIIKFSNIAWGTPLLILLLGGGSWFLIYSRFIPFRYLRHAVLILTGRYDNPDEPGQLNHYQALSTALASTIGMGNVSGVAVAIVTGGPGAIFWMWVSALIGVSTKFFTNTLAVMYRGQDDQGQVQGGPMYFITEGLGKNWKPLAVFFSVVCLIGVSPLFQTNQLTQVIRDVILIPNGVETGFITNLITGLVIAAIVALVVIGGVKRIGRAAGRLVPLMVIVYMAAVFFILFSHPGNILPGLQLIITDAFTGKAVAGGAMGAVLITGVRRAAFSNEAGLGTAPLAHGAAKTSEPVREGLVAMLGPIIDTIVVCSLTALTIIVTGMWQHPDVNGITLTAQAFEKGIPVYGPYILIVSISIFAITSLFAFPYYGGKCVTYLFGTRWVKLYHVVYTASILIGATSTLTVIISLIDGAFALMAIPTMVSAILLSPKVMKEAKSYFARLKEERA
ncbi:sodium:alanine symporter [Prolixibacter bellariivorans]|uniref:Sodium:alanine symporter n=1 Tax=Prolixibacter bellariivorans TaxID=314319 RepID=A0A5M4B0G2_9BACT|nr:alanine/glycine:cation symporter family protein [Prolixibacter bellariivorans]GET33371.1 sodium:alanine symporter [Prolixibacter bellariivorans]